MQCLGLGWWPGSEETQNVKGRGQCHPGMWQCPHSAGHSQAKHCPVLGLQGLVACEGGTKSFSGLGGSLRENLTWCPVAAL